MSFEISKFIKMKKERRKVKRKGKKGSMKKEGKIGRKERRERRGEKKTVVQASRSTSLPGWSYLGKATELDHTYPWAKSMCP